MNTQLAKTYGVVLAALAVAGLFVHGHLLGVINTDAAADTLRALLAGIFIFAGFMSRDYRVVNMALLGVGMLYVAMGVLGLINSTLGGVLPSGVTGFDIALHFIAGAVATWAGVRHHERIIARM